MKNKIILFSQAFLTALALNTELGIGEVADDGIASGFFRYIYEWIELLNQGIAGKGFFISVLALSLFAVYLWLDGKGEEAHVRGERFLAAFLSVMYTGGMAFWYGGDLSLLYGFGINRVRGVILLLGMFFFFRAAVGGLYWLLHREEGSVRKSGMGGKRYFFLVWGGIMAAWLVHLLARYPGAMSYDNWTQLSYYYGFEAYSTAQPIFHTWLFGSFVRLGIALGSANAGLFGFVVFQSLVMSAVLAWSLERMCCWATPVWLRRLTMAVYCVAPYFAGYAAFPIKDYLYTAFFAMLVLLLMELAQRGGGFWKSRRCCPAWVLAAVMMTLCRKNGIYVYIAVIFVYAVRQGCMFRRAGKQGAVSRKELLAKCLWPAVVILLPFVLIAAVEGAITQHYQVQKDSPKEMFSLPFQQTARYVKLYGDEIPEEEKEIISRVLDYDSLGELYTPLTADPLKTTYRAHNMGQVLDYFRVWAKELLRHPLCYLEATWNQNYYLFAPYTDNVVYNKNCYVGAELLWDEDFYDWLQFSVPDCLEGAANAAVSLYGFLTRAPLIGLFSNVAFYVILMFVLIHFFVADRNPKGWVMLPLAVSFAFILLAPQIQDQPRYAFPIIYTMPAAIAFYMRVASAGKRMN